MTTVTGIDGYKVLTWTGDFTADGRGDLLVNRVVDGNWERRYWTTDNATGLATSQLGNTKGFGRLDDGRPFWTGRFSRTDRSEVLFYYLGDRNWWLGTYDGHQLAWHLAGNTSGFGQVWDKRPFWSGDFNGDGRDEVLFYYPGDHNWWLGSFNGTSLGWRLAGNTAGFGQVGDGRPFWTGRFSRTDRTQLIFFSPGDHNWWLGTYDGNQIGWSLVGNTAGFGQVADGRPFWAADFTGDGKTDLLFYYPGDDNWWLGSVVAPPPENGQCPALRAKIAADRATLCELEEEFGDNLFPGPRPLPRPRPRPLPRNPEIIKLQQEIASLQQQMKSLGCGTQPPPALSLTWSLAGNTKGFGHAINDGRPFWTGRFSRPDRDQMLFYYAGDHHWWLGTHNGLTIAWSSAGTEVIDSVGQLNDAVSSGLWLADFRGEHLTSLLMYMGQHRDWWLGRMGSGTIDWEMVKAAPPPPPPPLPPPMVTVPNVVGLTWAAAIDALGRAHLKFEFEAPSGIYDPNTTVVTKQSPGAGAQVPQDSTVDLWVKVQDQAQGVKSLNLFNCNQDGRAVHIWLFDTSTGRWSDEGELAVQYAGGVCPGPGATPKVVSFDAGKIYTVVAVDPGNINCGANDPTNANCWRWSVNVRGDDNGPSPAAVIG